MHFDSPVATYSGYVVAASAIAVAIDQAWQRAQRRWSNEPPILPYRIPIVGHALSFARSTTELVMRANEYFPDQAPYSLIIFGKRIYVFSNSKDVSTVYRKSKELQFLPVVESLVGDAWGISKDGMRRLSEIDDAGDSLFRNAHVFYRDALKEGPQLDELTLSFIGYLNAELDARSDADPVSLRTWSRAVLGAASTNAMMGANLLGANPDLLDSVWLVEQGFFLFVNRVPRIVARKPYAARDIVMAAFARYLSDERNRTGAAPVIWDRDDQMRAKGMDVKDRAAYTYSAFALHYRLQNNSNPNAYWLLMHIFSDKRLLERLREEVAPIFGTTDRLSTLEQVRALQVECTLLRACFSETLRLHALAASNRRVVAPCVVGGRTLVPGRHVLCPSFAHHRAPGVFGPQTARFAPERFTSGLADPKAVRAFGGGVSMCTGRFFATNEVLAYAASVLWRFDVEFVPGQGDVVSFFRRKME